MENKEFQIIPLQGRSLLVVILSSEMTNYYWKELQTELANLNIADAEVYFDFLYRNGLKNRFLRIFFGYWGSNISITQKVNAQLWIGTVNFIFFVPIFFKNRADCVNIHSFSGDHSVFVSQHRTMVFIILQKMLATLSAS